MFKFLKMKQCRGFTLIELLVVVAIIGILATIILASLNTARMKARDTRRQSDIHQISLAMEMYYNAQPTPAYPTAATATPIPAAVKTAIAAYLPTVSDDPSGSTRGYTWLDNSSDSSNYCIYVQNEQSSSVYYLANKNGTGKKNAAPTTMATCVPNL